MQQSTTSHAITVAASSTETAFKRYHRRKPFIKEFIDAISPEKDEGVGSRRIWRGDTGGGSKQRRQERPTSYLPPVGIRRCVPNNLDLTFRNDLISYLSKHYLI